VKFIEKLFFLLFPHLLITGSPWETLWYEQEKKQFLNAVRTFFVLAMAVYVLHYYTVDRSEGLAPSDLWFNYRFGMAGLAALGLIFYSIPALYNLRFYKVPLILCCATFTYFQAQTVLWYAKVPYLYVFGFIFISAMMLRASILSSLILASLFTALTWNTLMLTGQSPAMVASASTVTLIFIVFTRAKYVSDINLFIATQRNLEQQKKFIEVNLEFTNQIKAFLPGEISKRLTYYVQESRMTTLQAIDEVLRPRTLPVACLYSDIRGFTRESNDLHGWVSQAMLPNVKISTELVEKHNGIPRKIGDLIFAYYDSTNQLTNIMKAILSAASISRFNSEMNASLPPEQHIKRYVLLSCGDAIVGNLSSYESAIEITAIGSPVNILSRIDELTKEKSIKALLEHGDIIMTKKFAEGLLACRPKVDVQQLDLAPLSVRIRDFDDQTCLYILKPSKKNLEALIDESSAETKLVGAA
jgi:class 3 adenylate cyclase